MNDLFIDDAEQQLNKNVLVVRDGWLKIERDGELLPPKLYNTKL